MEATIRIAADGEPIPKGGFVGALAGGVEPGASQAIEIDLRDVTGGDVIAGLLPVIAEAYRTAHFGEQEIPFPEAGDPHPFGTQVGPDGSVAYLDPTTGLFPDERPEESETPESVSQGGTLAEPQLGDCWALEFNDGSAGLYLFDGKEFMHPESVSPGPWEGGGFVESRHLPTSDVIAKRILVAANADYYKNAGDLL